jgi:hypothetical protein
MFGAPQETDIQSMIPLRQSFRLFAIATAGIAVACASVPIAIPVVSHENDAAALVGSWSGTYAGTESGRTGSIQFTLRAGDTAAFGDVVMIPRGFDRPLMGADRQSIVTRQPALLTITFVFVDDGSVSGALDPYEDPELGCLAVTTFRGHLTSRTVLEGTFVTRHPGTSIVQSGRWKVTRSATK